MKLTEKIEKLLSIDTSDRSNKMAEFEFQILDAVERRRKALKPEIFVVKAKENESSN